MNAKSKHIIGSFSYSAEKQLAVEEFDKIAKRENKSFSELLVELMEDYAKKHSEGNPSFQLTQWVEKPDFKPWPALDNMTQESISNMAVEEKEKLQTALKNTLDIVNRQLPAPHNEVPQRTVKFSRLKCRTKTCSFTAEGEYGEMTAVASQHHRETGHYCTDA